MTGGTRFSSHEETQSDSPSLLYCLSRKAFNYFDRDAKDVEDSSFTCTLQMLGNLLSFQIL